MKDNDFKEEIIEEVVDNQELVLDDSSKPTKKKKKSKGLGDVVKAVTNAIGIETCDSCEERRKKLNSMFSFLKSVRRDVTDEEITFIENIGKSITTDERYKLADIYTAVYGSKVNHCNCPALYNGMIDKLKMQIEYQKVG